MTTLPNWTPPQTKLRVYEAFYLLNRSFEATIRAVDRLERLEFFLGEDLSSLKSRLEYLSAETNESLLENVAEYEQNESFRFDQIVRDWEKERGDPDDVFFEARDRKREIREKIKELESGLARPNLSCRGEERPRKRDLVDNPQKSESRIRAVGGLDANLLDSFSVAHFCHLDQAAGSEATEARGEIPAVLVSCDADAGSSAETVLADRRGWQATRRNGPERTPCIRVAKEATSGSLRYVLSRICSFGLRSR